MPGIIYRAVPMRIFDFSGLGVSPAQSSIVAAKALDVSNHREVNVIVRFHAIPGVAGGVTWPTGAKLTISARADEPTLEDTSLDFVGADLASVQFSQGNDTPPSVKAFYLALPTYLFADHLRIYVTGTGGSGVTGTFQVMFSVDVNGKS